MRVSDLRSEIKQLVANSIEGMQHDNVSLVLVKAEEMGFPERLPSGRMLLLPGWSGVDLQPWLFAGGVCRPVPSKADQQSGERSKSAADG